MKTNIATKQVLGLAVISLLFINSGYAKDCNKAPSTIAFNDIAPIEISTSGCAERAKELQTRYQAERQEYQELLQPELTRATELLRSMTTPESQAIVREYMKARADANTYGTDDLVENTLLKGTKIGNKMILLQNYWAEKLYRWAKTFPMDRHVYRIQVSQGAPRIELCFYNPVDMGPDRPEGQNVGGCVKLHTESGAIENDTSFMALRLFAPESECKWIRIYGSTYCGPSYQEIFPSVGSSCSSSFRTDPIIRPCAQSYPSEREYVMKNLTGEFEICRPLVE